MRNNPIYSPRPFTAVCSHLNPYNDHHDLGSTVGKNATRTLISLGYHSHLKNNSLNRITNCSLLWVQDIISAGSR